jgi:hypothetical protein
MQVTNRDPTHLEAIEKLINEKIEGHHGDLSQLPPSEAGEDKGRSERRGNGRDRDRGRERGPRRDAPVHKNDTQTVETGAVIDIDSKRPEKPMAKNTAAAKKDVVAPRPERSHQERAHVANDRSPYPAANDDNRRRRYHQQDDGPTPVGFGDDVPAFMLTSAALK